MVQWVTVGLSGGLLDYCKVHETENEAKKDGDRTAKSYGVTSWDEDDQYHIYVVPGDGSF